MSSVLAVIAACLAVYFASVAAKRKKELLAHEQEITEYRKISDPKKEIEHLSGEVLRIKTIFNKEQARYDTLAEELRTTESRYRNLEEKTRSFQATQEMMTEVGVYTPLYDFGTSEEYKNKLEEIRERQKQLIKFDEAVEKRKEWTVVGDKKAGEKITNNVAKLVLRAFNGECDSVIAKVKFGNVEAYRKKIYASAEALNKLTEMWGIAVTAKYVELKISELHLVYEYQEKLETEREEQRRIREQMREEERAQKELEKARQEAEKEEGRFQQALEKARKELEHTAGKEADALAAKIAELQQQLEEARKRTERAISQAQMTKSGHVYVISNIGSFGEHVYKIGMTRRLEPMERVKELGDASVPFEFDVHALIYSENAPELENSLHKLFDKKRVNRINERREFFRITLEEIEQAVQQSMPHAVFAHTAAAKEFRQTQALLAQEGKTVRIIPENTASEIFA